MFFGKSEKDSLWSQVVPTKMFLKKKTFNYSITLLQQSSDKKDAQLFCYFGYIKSIEMSDIPNE